MDAATDIVSQSPQQMVALKTGLTCYGRACIIMKNNEKYFVLSLLQRGGLLPCVIVKAAMTRSILERYKGIGPCHRLQSPIL